jgi:hypothetical protein
MICVANTIKLVEAFVQAIFEAEENTSRGSQTL